MKFPLSGKGWGLNLTKFFLPCSYLEYLYCKHCFLFFISFNQSMKNISCFKLSIDRTKAPKKNGFIQGHLLVCELRISCRGSFYFTGWCWKGSKDDKGTAAKDFFTRYPNGWFNRLFDFLSYHQKGKGSCTVIQIKVKPTVSFHNQCTRAPVDPILHSKRRD